MSNPNDTQIGGEHYKKATFQPWDWALQRHGSLGHYEVSIIQYVTRFREKGGKQDLEKAMHYLDKMIYEHSRNDYYNMANKLRGSTQLTMFRDQNKIDKYQSQVVHLMAIWHDVSDLEMAKSIITTTLLTEYS